MIRVLPLLPLLALAACDAPPPRPDTKGQQLHAAVDKLSDAYANCLGEKVKTVPLTDDPAGSMVFDLIKTCKPQRRALIDQIAIFHRFGHPRETEQVARIVAEASVQELEKDMREAAVITLVKRQNNMDAKS